MVDTTTSAGKAAFAAALAAIFIGAVVFAGWLLDLDSLKRVVPGLVAMNPVTAVALVLAGSSLAISLQPQDIGRGPRVAQWLAFLCALLVMFGGLAIAIAILGGRDLGVDGWILASKLRGGPGFHHRVAPNTALNMALIGGALLFVRGMRRTVRFGVEFAVLAAGFASLLADLGYFYGIPPSQGFGPLGRMPLPAAIGFTMLVGGILLSHSDGGLLAMIAGKSEAGAVARRLLPAALLVPAVLGVIKQRGEAAGIYDAALGNAGEVLGNIVIFTALICWSAQQLFKASLGSEKAETASRSFLQSTLDALSAHIAILDEFGTIVEVNWAWERFAGDNNLEARRCGVGANYLKVCDSAMNALSDEAAEMAIGIRAVIVGNSDGFQLEYPCHSSKERRWFLVRVTRFAGEGPARVVVAHENITQRKLAEEKWRQSETKFNQLANNVTDAFWITSPDMETLHYVSPGYERIWGRSMQSSYDKPHQWMEAILPEDRENVRAGLASLMSDASETDLQYRIARPDGSIRWVHDRGFQVRDAAGALVRLTGIATDITERKHAEDELLWKTALLEAQVHSSIDGMLVVNEQRQKVLQNRRFAEMLEVPERIADNPDDKEQIVWVANMAKDSEGFIARVRHLYAHPKEIGRDEIELKNGKVMDRYSAPVIAKDGTTYGRIWQFRDVTEKKRVEARFRRLVDSNVQGILFWNVNGGVTGANDSLLSLTGFTRADLEAGRINWISMTPPEYAQRDRNAFAEIAVSGVSRAYEKEYIRKDGSRVPVLLGSAAFEDNPKEGVCFVLDLTDRRRLEAQLFESQKLETAGKLAGGIAHEFNSILTTIIGQSEMLLDGPIIGSRSSAIAAEIRNAAERAAALTRQLLAYGSKQILQPAILDLNAVLTSMDGVLQRLIGPGIELKMVAAAGLRQVSADAGYIEQVIRNLVVNAADAMPGGGALTLETANVSLDEERVAGFPDLEPGNYAMLTVADTGVGMSEEVRARAFDPFFTTKAIGDGSGLGLSTSYGIIKQSGGIMTVESELARGSIFRIYLPAVQLTPAAANPGVISAGLPRGMETIMLVERDATMREVIETLLTRLGYTVFSAANGLEAMSLMQPPGVRIDLLLTDVDMPLISGKELSERFRELHPNAKTLFASTSAVAGSGNGNAHYLRKPFPPSALARRLREVLSG